VTGDGPVFCPFHDNRRTPAGSVYRDEAGVWRYKCHNPECGASGDYLDLRARRKGVPLKDVLPGREESDSSKIYRTPGEVRRSVPGRITGEYSYRTAGGELSFVRFRYEPGPGGREKGFVSYRPVPGGYVRGEPPAPRVLYNLAAVVSSPKVVVAEGEKCVDVLRSFGIPATCSTDGSGAPRRSNWAPLAGKEVVIWPDADAPGTHYAEEVTAILHELDPPCRVRMVPRS